MGTRTPLQQDAVSSALERLPAWRAHAGALHAAYVAPSAAAALALVARIGEAAEQLDHHPDVDWRYDTVFVRSTTHSAGGVLTPLDLALAERVDAVAGELSARPDPGLVRIVEIGVDSADPARVKAAWVTALGYREGRDVALCDPWGRGPTVWFQQTDTPAASRLHLDVHVAADAAPGLVSEVEASGAQRVDDSAAPSWWVLRDAEGNRLCVCTPAVLPTAGAEAAGGEGAG